MATARPPLRKALLVVHVITSVGWLGAAVCMFALAWTGHLTGSRQLEQSVYDVMLLLTNGVLVPLALLAFATGIVSSLLTPWGLLRYWWVAVKLGATAITAALSVFVLRPRVAVARHAVHIGDAHRLSTAGISLMAATLVSTSVYALLTIISVYKPWGRTRRASASTPMSATNPQALQRN